MKKEHISIKGIPAILWGENKGKLFIAVHGDQSHKEDTVIQIFAEKAVCCGYQVLSFDLPEHGERKDSSVLCKVQNCVVELQQIINYGKSLTKDINLFGCSLGVYFSLVAYKNEKINKSLFLSPVVDMKRLIENMMLWFNISKEQLELEKVVSTPIGKVLYWDYYCYVMDNPIEKWGCKTAILYGEKDELSEFSYVSDFAEKFCCDLTVMKNGEHFFHTEEQIAYFRKWLNKSLL